MKAAEDGKKRDFEGEKAYGTVNFRHLVVAHAGTRRIFGADSYFSSFRQLNYFPRWILS